MMNFSNLCFEEGDENDFVEFADDIVTKKVEEKKDNIPKIEYDEITMKRYAAMRYRKLDPIGYIDTEDEYSFKFGYVWDPYTGERKNYLDENGPLCFDPDILIKHFYTKMLSKLWVEPSDEHGGYYQGYYDSGVGAGETFYVAGRGHHPEWYIFRLPIIDCYLTKDHNNQHITFGPKLSNDEVEEIDKLASKRPNNFKAMFGHDRPSLVIIKKLYDQAIASKPILENKPENIGEEELQNIYNRENRAAVDKLLKIAGKSKQ